MLISELIKVLNNRIEKHGDIEVKITWEGMNKGILSSYIWKSGGELIIDADENYQKKDYADDVTEGEDGN